VYRASEVTADAKVRGQIKQLQESGYGHYPVCVAKTQYSFSTDAQLRGAPPNHVVNIREVRLAAGAEFVVMICGDIMTMPGLPRPSAMRIDVSGGASQGDFLTSVAQASAPAASSTRRTSPPTGCRWQAGSTRAATSVPSSPQGRRSINRVTTADSSYLGMTHLSTSC
jgi:hypothetical protein